MKQLLRYASITILPVLLLSCGRQVEETKPVRKDVTETVFASGELEAEDTYNLTAQTEGYLEEINFERGDVIKAGQVLASVSNTENIINTQSADALYDIARANTAASAPLLQQALQAVQIARDKLQQDSVQMGRYQRLYSLNSIAKADYDNAVLQYNNSLSSYKSAVQAYRQQQQSAEQQLISNEAQKRISQVNRANNQVKAVVGGMVYQQLKQTGDFVRKGDVIAIIGSAGRLYAKVSVDETNIGKVKVGQQALVQLNTGKSKAYRGRVAEIYPAFDEATQSFFCKIVFDEEPDFKAAGTQLQSNIIIAEHKNALLIPRNYLDFGGRVRLKGEKEPVKVETGFVSNQWVEVKKGLDDNAVLITDNIASNKETVSDVGKQMR